MSGSPNVATREAAHAWELRKHWALGTEVICVLDQEAAQLPRVRGLVIRVAATGTAVWVDDGIDEEGVHVPVAAILTVRKPSYQEDGSEPRRRAPKRLEPAYVDQLSFADLGGEALTLDDLTWRPL